MITQVEVSQNKHILFLDFYDLLQPLKFVCVYLNNAVETDKKSGADAEDSIPLQTTSAGVSAVSSTGGEQTTLVHNEEEAFALEPLDITTFPGKMCGIAVVVSFFVCRVLKNDNLIVSLRGFVSAGHRVLFFLDLLEELLASHLHIFL